jgi:putative FmdB family regulatory protein
MPTYDYRCANCGHEFEAFQSITSEPLKKCPACRRHKLQRLIGPGAGIIFRGSGFYVTDYKNGSRRPSSAASSKEGTVAGDDKAASPVAEGSSDS